MHVYVCSDLYKIYIYLRATLFMLRIQRMRNYSIYNCCFSSIEICFYFIFFFWKRQRFLFAFDCFYFGFITHFVVVQVKIRRDKFIDRNVWFWSHFRLVFISIFFEKRIKNNAPYYNDDTKFYWSLFLVCR